MALRVGTEVSHARRIRLPSWRTMGGGVLVARNSWQWLYATRPRFAPYGRQRCSCSLGKTSYCRRETRWFTRVPDAEGTIGSATRVGWSDAAGDRNGAWSGRRNGPQPFQEGASKARDPQSHAHSGRSHARPHDYLRRHLPLRITQFVVANPRHPHHPSVGPAAPESPRGMTPKIYGRS